MTTLSGLPVAEWIAAVALHGTRLVPIAVLCPFLGGPFVPAAVRAALAFGLGGCAWAAAGSQPVAVDGLALLVAGLRELTLGTALAVVSAIPFEAARAAGRLVDTLRGSTLTELHVAPLRQRESATGDLLAQWCVVLAGSVGGDRLVIASLLDTFRALPAGAGAGSTGGALLGAALHGAGELLACAVAVGAPAAAGVLAADLVLAVASRAAPHLQLGPSAPAGRAALGLLAVVVPVAAIAGRLTSSVALSSTLVRELVRGVAP